MATVALVMQRINNGVVNMMATGFTQERCVVGVAGGAHKVITWHLFYLICNEIGAIISNKVKFIKLPDFFIRLQLPCNCSASHHKMAQQQFVNIPKDVVFLITNSQQQQNPNNTSIN